MKYAFFALPLILGWGWVVVGCTPKPTETAVAVSWDGTQPMEQFTDTTRTQLLVLSGITLGRIDRIVWFDNRYYIVDRQTQTVAAFDSTGKFLFPVGRKGRGPGEYVNLMDLSIDRQNNQLILYVDRPHSLMYFSADGTYLSTRSLDGVPYSYTAVPDGEYLYLNNTNTKNREPTTHSLTTLRSSDLSVVEQATRAVLNPYSVACGGTDIGQSNGRLFWTCPFDFTIRELKDGSFTNLYKIDFGARAFPERYLRDEVLDPSKLNEELLKNKYIIGITSVVETPTYLFFRSNFDRFFAIEKEQLVLREYQPFSYHKSSVLASGALMPVEGADCRIAFVVESWMFSFADPDQNMKLDPETQSIVLANVDMNPVIIIADVR